MNILLTNDDGYQAKGIQVLAKMMKNFGDVYVIAPKTHQSGMSMAVSLGFKAIRYKELLSGPGLTVAYLDATPASCVKYALDSEVSGWPRPDVVVSGINHGSNAASASCYSGTLGAAQEAALCGIPAIGVSLNSMNPDADFTAVVRYFPDIFRKLIEADTGNGNTKDGQDSRYGIYYNVNFPDIPVDRIRGIRTGYQGKGHWIKEFTEWHSLFFDILGTTLNVDTSNAEEVCAVLGNGIEANACLFIDNIETGVRGILVDNYLVLFTSSKPERKNFPINMEAFVRWLTGKVRECITDIQSGIYNERVRKELPSHLRFGTISCKNYWDIYPKKKNLMNAGWKRIIRIGRNRTK